MLSPAEVLEDRTLLTLSHPFALLSLDGSDGFAVIGAEEDDSVGISVGVAGDFNGDGFDDLLVGTPYAEPSFQSDVGETYLILGKPGGFADLNVSSLDGTNGVLFSGEQLRPCGVVVPI